MKTTLKELRDYITDMHGNISYNDYSTLIDMVDTLGAVPTEEIEKAWESISDVAENGYVDMEEVKLWFAKWLGKDEDEL